MSQETDQDIESINLTIEQAQHSVALGQALGRLQQNPDFKALIVDDFLREQPIRLGHLMCDPSMQSKEQQKNIVADIKAIGNFHTYLNLTFRRAQMAAEAIRVNEDELDEIYKEQADAHVTEGM